MLNNGLKNKHHILFFTPYYKQNRGNATTAKRMVAGLLKEGYEVSIFAYEEEKWTSKWEIILEAADLYHILHLRRFASWQKQHQLSLTKPYVLTSGGTDVNEDLSDPDAAMLMKSVADESCAITVFSQNGKEKITAVFPELQERIHVIPQSIWLPESTSSKKNEVQITGSPSFLLPAGLRPVKDVFYLWDALEQLRKEWTGLTFSIIGSALDKQVFEEIEARETQFDWFRYLGEVSLAEMAEVYEQCDFVLNTSRSEGQPTSLLEAMFLGKPVIARKIPGNESIIQHKKNGIIFDSPSQFVEYVSMLLHSPDMISSLKEEGTKYINTHHQLQGEIALYTSVYTHCIDKAQKNAY